MGDGPAAGRENDRIGSRIGVVVSSVDNYLSCRVSAGAHVYLCGSNREGAVCSGVADLWDGRRDGYGPAEPVDAHDIVE